jgi:hypothetical protein
VYVAIITRSPWGYVSWMVLRRFAMPAAGPRDVG